MMYGAAVYYKEALLGCTQASYDERLKETGAVQIAPSAASASLKRSSTQAGFQYTTIRK